LTILLFFGTSYSQTNTTTNTTTNNTTPTVVQTSASTANTEELARLRNSWCGSTTVRDYRLNDTERFNERRLSSNSLASTVSHIVNGLNGGSSTEFIQAFKAEFGLLLTLMIIVFASMIAFFVFTCYCKKESRNKVTQRNCLNLASVCYGLFFILFILLLVFIAFNEISQRRSKCQVLNVGNMLVNGYQNKQNGNEYVGMVNQYQSALNFKNDVANVVNAKNAANMIMNENYPRATQQAIDLLQAVAVKYVQSTSYNAFGASDTPRSIRSLTGWVSNEARQEFSALKAVGDSMNSAAMAVQTLISNHLLVASSRQANLDNSMSAITSFWTVIIENVYQVAYESYSYVAIYFTYAAAGYWTLFGMTLVIIPLSVFLLYNLRAKQNGNKINTSMKTLKTILAFLGFLMFIYILMVMILLVGSTVISAFCRILEEVNGGNFPFIDRLNINWPGNTRQILKECTVSSDGQISDFLSLSPTGNNATFAASIQAISMGVINSQKMVLSGNMKTSSALSVLVSHYNAIKSGILYDYVNVNDMFDFVYNTFPTATTGLVPSLTDYNCTASYVNNTALNRTCLPIDINNVDRFNVTVGGLPYTNWTIVRNLNSYITSEQTLLNQIENDLFAANNASPAQAYTDVAFSIKDIQPSVAVLAATFPSTLAPYAMYKGMAQNTFNCKNIRRELLILEDHYCFSLNFWVYNTLVLASVSFLLLFIMTWALCATIREVDADKDDYPQPEAEKNADVDEGENIPNDDQ